MAPKIQAVINFLEAGGKHAIVTDPANIARALAGETGTHFVPSLGNRDALCSVEQCCQYVSEQSTN
jgi:hypothetical protein